jgi:hypothetical protein
VFPQGYAGDQLTDNLLGTGVFTVGATNTYGGTLSGVPVRPFKTEASVTLAAEAGTPTFLFRDIDGDGNLVGTLGGFGTINYLTGAVTLTFPTGTVVNGGDSLFVTYATDFEQQTEIPKIIMRLTTKSVNARVFALKDTIGLEQSYALRRRFGLIAEDEVAYRSMTCSHCG